MWMSLSAEKAVKRMKVKVQNVCLLHILQTHPVAQIRTLCQANSGPRALACDTPDPD